MEEAFRHAMLKEQLSPPSNFDLPDTEAIGLYFYDGSAVACLSKWNVFRDGRHLFTECEAPVFWIGKMRIPEN